MTPGLVAIAAYLALQLGIGVWIARRIRNESDYLLAGRSLGYTFATFSIFATWFGSETVVGSAGNSFRDGVSLGNAEPFGYGLCLILMGLVFLLTQAREYSRVGFAPHDGAFGTIFFGLTGLHGAHVFIGLTLLSVATVRAFRGHFTPEHHHGVEIGGIYWHFVDVMWIVVYSTVYLL